MDFNVKVKVMSDVALLYPKGHLDAHNVEHFETEIVKLIDNKSVNIIINCAELNYISSAGMGIIMIR